MNSIKKMFIIKKIIVIKIKWIVEMKMLKLFLIINLLTIFNNCLAVDLYTTATNQLVVASVDVSGTFYNNVVITVDKVIAVQGGIPKSNIDTYDLRLNQLTIPSVQVNDLTYTNIIVTVDKVISIGNSNANTTSNLPNGLVWNQTLNSVRIENDGMSSYISRMGFGAFNIYGNKIKSFMFPSGYEFITPRAITDNDFLVFSFDDKNQIYLDKPPENPKYIAGFVSETFQGNFGKGPDSFIMFDTGRESRGAISQPLWERSYLWRMDYVNGSWLVSEFGQEFGRQYWHSSGNPIDINNDGVLDFVASNLMPGAEAGGLSKKLVLFTSISGTSNYKITDLTKSLCSGISTGSGSSALIKLQNNRFAVISFPYSATSSQRSNLGSIIYLDSSGLLGNSTDCINVRGDALTSDLTDGEGYDAIKVLDINNDGLDDFIAIAEPAQGGMFKTKRLLAVIQDKNSKFRVGNSEVNLPFTYSLPNLDASTYSDWVSNEFVVGDINGDGKADIFLNTQLIQANSVATYGLRGGILNVDGKMKADFSIPPERLNWNKDGIPAKGFRYIFPTELNGDGVMDFLLVATYFDNTLVTPTNQYGSYFRVSALISKRL